MPELRPCIRRMGPDMFRASNSLAALAYHNELSGFRMFRCATIQAEGWCLGAECDLFVVGAGGGGAPTGGSGAEPPAVSSHTAATPPLPHQHTNTGLAWPDLPLPLGRERSRLQRLKRKVVC